MWNLCVAASKDRSKCYSKTGVCVIAVQQSRTLCSFKHGIISEFLFAHRTPLYRQTPEILLKRLVAILDRLLERGLLAAAHKAVFVRKKIKQCGKILSGQTVSHGPEHTQGLSELRRPETAGELMYFFQAINWMLMSLSELVELEASLRRCSKSVCATHAHQARGGPPCHWQQRVDGRTHGPVGCCATTGERGSASKSVKARIICDDVP